MVELWDTYRNLSLAVLLRGQPGDPDALGGHALQPELRGFGGGGGLDWDGVGEGALAQTEDVVLIRIHLFLPRHTL